ncbi:hypothetical protein HM1_2455 [Heliomicrobium modesticaldum Ice1]|uniref:Uncharacterized protein n=1 Tax=Heliobacterium modesticaldum (strain ATCC 51547 / Ice1) TaxID=498761 RepID=B0TAF5_HELMI|nr:hypothetical protein HM1_2455 [Heliomicrobium modesticaldum Ice1]
MIIPNGNFLFNAHRLLFTFCWLRKIPAGDKINDQISQRFRIFGLFVRTYAIEIAPSK